MKTIDTLVEDIESVIYGQGGWNKSVAEAMGKSIADTANKRFSKPQEPRGYLSLSSIGTPCKRKLWYKINKPDFGEPLDAKMLLKFFYGDMIEELILAMVDGSGKRPGPTAPLANTPFSGSMTMNPRSLKLLRFSWTMGF